MTHRVYALIASAAAEQSWLSTVVQTAFDPQWNLEHRSLIWAIIMVVLFLSGMGLPLPEDIPLTITGFTAFKQSNDAFVFSHYLLAFAMVTVAILSGDLVAYWAGRRYGMGLRDRFRFARRVLTEKRLAKVQRWFDKYGSFTVFLGRQVAGVRIVTFFTSGAMRVPIWKFVLFDFIGCCVTVPVWMTLGTLAARYGSEWLNHIAGRVGVVFVIAAIGAFLLFFMYVKRKEKRAEQA